MNQEQNKLVVALVQSVVALEKAEVKFDTSSKAIIALFEELLGSGDVTKALKEKALVVYGEMVVVVKGVADIKTTTEKRIVSVLDTVLIHYSLGLRMRVSAIAFTDLQRVCELVEGGNLSKSQLTKAHKQNEADKDYEKAIKDLIVIGAYKKLVGTVDYSMLDEDTVTLVKALSKDDLKGLQGLVKVQLGA